MPVLPLFDTPADPDAWHHVTAPGGYERWYFDAEDESGQLRVVINFIEGADFDTDYLSRYHRYRSRPTRVPPPQAREYPCVQLALYEKGSRLCAESLHGHPGEFFASDERPEVRVGPSGFRREDDGALRVEVRQRQCSADLLFRPLFHPARLQRSLVPGEGPGGEHHWIVARPLCHVEGHVRVTAARGGPREAPFTGLGYHDHHFGTRPLRTSLVRRLWGRLLTEDRALVFHVATPSSSDQPDDVQFLETDAAGFRLVSAGAWNADWSGRVSRGAVYPATIALARLRLANPRLLDSNPDQLRLEYDVDGEGTHRRAFCEVVHPPALHIRRRWL